MYHDDKATVPPDDDVFNKSLNVFNKSLFLRKCAHFFRLLVAFHIGQWNKAIPLQNIAILEYAPFIH